MYVYICM